MAARPSFTEKKSPVLAVRPSLWLRLKLKKVHLSTRPLEIVTVNEQKSCQIQASQALVLIVMVPPTPKL